jgi:cellulose synthase/poly-beta-1,6-N-acetylglucosamine synthase-like glycosyltransferase
MQTVEFMSLIGAGAVSMHAGAPNMCNGANLMYEKQAFEAVNGFEGAWHLASGDDEFLMHKIHAAFPRRVRFLKDPETIVRTGAHETFKGFFYQRKRWASKWNHYSNIAAVALAIAVFSFHLLCVGLWISACLGFASTALPLLAIKMLAEWPYLHRLMRFHGHKQPALAIFCTAFLHSFYIVGIGIAGKIGGYEWKGRLVK